MDLSTTEIRQTATLQGLREQLERSIRPQRLSDERFDQAHELFEQSSNQQASILRWLLALCRTNDRAQSPQRILSVGCGNGILDIPLIREISDCWDLVNYTGVEPNLTACRRFLDGFRQDQHANVQLQLYNQTVETLEDDQRYDLILAIHSLYYVADPAESIEFLHSMLSPGGRLVIVQAPRGKLNDLADCFWRRPRGDAMWYSGRLERHLATRGFSYHTYHLPSKIDVAQCLEAGSSQGELILDFIAQVDCRNLSAGVRQSCLDYLRQIGCPEGDRFLVPHPTDLFVIESPVHSTPSIPSVLRLTEGLDLGKLPVER